MIIITGLPLPVLGKTRVRQIHGLCKYQSMLTIDRTGNSSAAYCTYY